MKIGIYGGSFNPVHYGHVNLARRAIADLSLDLIIVVPASVSPFKVNDAPGREICPWSRMDFVTAAFSDIEKVRVDDREIKRGGVSYTIDTVREIISENGQGEYFFIIGEDSLAGLDRWKDIEELKRLVTFKAYPRTEESSSEIRRLFEAAGVVLNPDKKIADAVAAGVLRKKGYCPCRLKPLPEFFCPCDEFKGQMADDSYHGPCHCRLYIKP